MRIKVTCFLEGQFDANSCWECKVLSNIVVGVVVVVVVVIAAAAVVVVHVIISIMLNIWFYLSKNPQSFRKFETRFANVRPKVFHSHELWCSSIQSDFKIRIL